MEEHIVNIESITVTNFCSFGEKNNILQINPGVTTIVVVSRVMRKFDLALAEIYFRGRVHAPWLPSSGQGAKGQGRRYAARLALDAL